MKIASKNDVDSAVAAGALRYGRSRRFVDIFLDRFMRGDGIPLWLLISDSLIVEQFINSTEEK